MTAAAERRCDELPELLLPQREQDVWRCRRCWSSWQKVGRPLFWWKLVSSEIICFRKDARPRVIITRSSGRLACTNWGTTKARRALSAIITERRSRPPLWKRMWPRDWMCLLQSDCILLRTVGKKKGTTVLIVAPSYSHLNDFGVYR